MDFEGLGEGNSERDIISRLPDDILVHILSLLETKNVVQTCVLSSRWKNLWTFVYNLHFDDIDYEIGRYHYFGDFVNRVLSFSQCKDIQDFTLKCSVFYNYELTQVIQWLCFAVKRRVRKLNIRIDTYEDELCVVRLPQSFLTCNTLVELRLLSDFVFDIPDSTMCFPSLKLLVISIVHPKGDLKQKLFRSCPVLEDLSIRGTFYNNEGAVTFEIVVPTLKRLRIWLYIEAGSNHKFLVTASNLEYLNIGGYFLASFIVNGRPLLNEVSLDVGVDFSLIKHYSQLDEFEVSHDEDNQAMKLLRGINYTKILSLTSRTMTFLNLRFDDNMPTFSNLILLDLCIEARFGWKLLPHFLNSSSNLEVLILKMDFNLEYVLEEFVHFELENVSSCLRSHVKAIEIRNMTGGVSELEVISYMLKNSEVLEEFSMDIPNEDLRIEILMYPRTSAACEIKFL